MQFRFRHRALGCVLAAALVLVLPGSPWSPPNEKSNVLLSTMQQELERAQTNLNKLEPPAYFLSYSVFDQSTVTVVASEGALLNSNHLRRRTADVTMRVGSPALDNAHEQNRESAITSGLLPLDDDSDRGRLSYEEYRQASKAFLKVKAGTRP